MQIEKQKEVTHMGANKFAEMLKYYLMLNDKTQKDLVDNLGFDKSTVSSWCSGNRVPKIDVIIDIAKYLHVNVGDLIEDTRNEDTYNLNANISNFSVSPIEKDLITAFRNADELDRQMVLRILKIEEKGDAEKLA